MEADQEYVGVGSSRQVAPGENEAVDSETVVFELSVGFSDPRSVHLEGNGFHGFGIVRQESAAGHFDRDGGGPLQKGRSEFLFFPQLQCFLKGFFPCRLGVDGSVRCLQIQHGFRGYLQSSHHPVLLPFVIGVVACRWTECLVGRNLFHWGFSHFVE